MTFPVLIPFGPLSLHPHWVLETLAYALGFRLYSQDRKHAGDFLSFLDRAWVVAAAVAGAALGSKLLYWFEDPHQTLARWNDPIYLLGGKTIVGGLLGGTIAVEWTKKSLGITRRTGDLFAIPLALGIAIGRIGCFLSGLGDQTYGVVTNLPWGIDFGDGISRHPTQLYESIFCLALAAALTAIRRQAHPEGFLFRVFLAAYLGGRVVIDFWKPGVPFAGLTSLQWCALAGCVYYLAGMVANPKEVPAHG